MKVEKCGNYDVEGWNCESMEIWKRGNVWI
jgi:hypothetical protein